MPCLNLFVFCYCDTPVICSDDTRYAGDTRGLTQDNGGPIHELQIAAFPACTLGHSILDSKKIYRFLQLPHITKGSKLLYNFFLK